MTIARREDRRPTQHPDWQGPAHDIKNILASVSLIADELEAGDGRAHQLSVRLNRSCARILEICGTCRPEPEPAPAEPLSIGSVIEDVREIALGLAAGRVHVRAAGEAPAIPAAAAGPMFRILSNLATNAVAAMRETGGRLEFASMIAGGALHVDVVDTGPGMRRGPCGAGGGPDMPERWGQGLRIAHGLAAEIGAELALLRTGPEGTTFRVSLPLAAGGSA